jgi:hypothetical protein
LSAEPAFFAHVCDCSTRREVVREDAEKHRQYLIDERLISEPDSSDGEDEKEVVPAEGVEDGMDVDA